MYALTSRYQIRPGAIDERLRYSAEVTRPQRNARPGARGLLILIDWPAHTNLTVDLWESAARLEEAHSSAALRDALGFAGYTASAVQQETFAVVQEDLRSGARFAAVTSYDVHAGQMEERIQHGHTVTASAAAAQPGYQGVLVLADRDRDRSVSITLWASETAWRAARDTPSFHDKRPLHRYAAGPVTEETFEVAYVQI